MSVLVQLTAIEPLSDESLRTGRIPARIRRTAETLDLDRSWEVLEAVLGTAVGLDGGTELDADVRYLAPDEVARCSRELSGLGKDEIEGRLDRVLADPGSLYGGPWTPAAASPLLERIAGLRSFYRSAFGARRGVLVELC